jgi:hypothetical protein
MGSSPNCGGVVPQLRRCLRRGAARRASLRGGGVADGAVAGLDLAARGGGACLDGAGACLLRCSLSGAGVAGFRFARGERMRATGWSVVCSAACRASESGLDGADSAGLRSNSSAQRGRAGSYGLRRRCQECPRRAGLPLHKPPPTPPLATAWRGDKFRDASYIWELAATGHRGRVNARGKPSHAPSGLTRTSGLRAGAPCRVTMPVAFGAALLERMPADEKCASCLRQRLA